MMAFMKKLSLRPHSGLACFFCGVDSTPLIIFFIGLLGSLAFASLFTMIGLWMKGQFHNTEHLRDEVLRAEKRV